MMKKVMLLSLIVALCVAGSVYALPKPVAHWTLDEDSGLPADQSGNGYDAVALGGGETQGIEGVYEKGLKFNGSGSWMDVPLEVWNDHVVVNQAFTICFWYKLEQSDLAANAIFGSNTTGGGRMLQSHLPWTNGNIYFDYNGRNTANFANNGGVYGEWQHWTYQYTPGMGRRLLLNGNEIMLAADTDAMIAHDTFVFGANTGHGASSQAAVDDLRIYDVILTDEEIVEAMEGGGLTSLGAHTPVPTGTVLSNDVPATTSVSWYSPLQDGDGIAIPDSNIVSVDNYKVWWSVNAEPNFIDDTPDDNGTSQSYTPTTPITYDTTYYWRVDTTITLDANDITGEFNSVIEGSVWNFITEPSYTPVAIDTFDNVITTVDLGTADLVATVTGNSEPLYSVDFEILTDAPDYPAGSDAVLSDDGPTALTTTLTTTYAGSYKVKITVTDYNDAGTGPETTVTDIAEVAVYADACQAIKDAPSGWAANYYDRDGDCNVNLGDWDELATEWMDDTAMDDQENYTGTVGYVPQALYDIRTEAEDIVDPNDPNYFSGPPTILDTTGIRIGAQYTEASGGLCLTNGTNGWVAYDIDVPVAAVGVPVDLYIGYSRNGSAGAVSLGTEVGGEEALYGTVSLGGTGGWGTFSSGSHTLTFTASGVQKFKFTMVTPVNLDWFVFDWPE